MKSISKIVLGMLIACMISCENQIVKKDSILTPEGTLIVKRYYPEIYHPNTEELSYLNYQNYDESKMKIFINGLLEQYNLGDIIMVDGLKWQKSNITKGTHKNIICWVPYPNPPIPTFKPERETIIEHQNEYFNWINHHPHFDYPPSPPPFDTQRYLVIKEKIAKSTMK